MSNAFPERIVPSPSVVRTMADLVRDLGSLQLDRVWAIPAPGTATDADVTYADVHFNRLCELVDNTLVEKVMGLRESILALAIASVLRAFVIPRNLGLVSGEAGMFRLFPGCIRMPDVAFASNSSRKGRPITDPAPDMAPDLAVEILSITNSVAEMNRKRNDYFSSGVKLVWIFDPQVMTVSVYTSVNDAKILTRADTLDGGEVLPGLSILIKSLFDEVDQQIGATSVSE